MVALSGNIKRSFFFLNGRFSLVVLKVVLTGGLKRVVLNGSFDCSFRFYHRGLVL